MNPGENNAFDKQLQEKFEGFRPEVSKGLWDKIAVQLDADEARFIVRTPIKRRRFTTWWMAAAAILAVCGVLYWQNRPVAVTYLHAHVDTTVVPGKNVAESPKSIEVAEPVAEPLDLERLRKVFAKRSHKVKTKGDQPPVREERRQPEEASFAKAVEFEERATGELGNLSTDRFLQRLPDSLEAVIAGVPDIEPLVVLEEEEETMLAATEGVKQPFGLSNILNYVVSTVDQRDEKLVTFSNDEEGSLKLDFNFGLAKNRKKKLK